MSAQVQDAGQFEEHIRRLVEQAPPLSQSQRDRLALPLQTPKGVRTR